MGRILAGLCLPFLLFGRAGAASPPGGSPAGGTARNVGATVPLTGDGTFASDPALSISAAANSVPEHRTAADHLQLVKTPRLFNVRDPFGAVCDGVTDDTTAIGRAWRAAAGSQIYYPTGNCVDRATHSLAAGQIVFGDGPGRSVVLTRHGSLQAFVIPATSFGAQILGLTIQGNAPANGFGGIKVQGGGFGTHASVSDVEILNMTSHGLLVDGSWKDRFENVYSHNNAGDGFRVQKQTYPPNNAAHVNFYECWSENNGGNGFTVTSADANPNTAGIYFVNSTSAQNAGNGYDLLNVTDALFVGSYSAREKGGVGINAIAVANLDVVGGGYHDLASAIDLTSSTATIRSVFFASDKLAIRARTGTRGTSRGNYAPTAVSTYLKTDPGAVSWSDETASSNLAGVTTRYTDDGAILGPWAAKAYISANQLIAAGTDIALTFDSEVFDNGAVHSQSSNTSRLTVPAGGAGIWLCTCQITYVADTTGTFRDLYVYKNGTARIAFNRQKVPETAILVGLSAPAVASMADGDYFECLTRHDGAGAINAYSGAGLTFGTAVRVGSRERNAGPEHLEQTFGEVLRDRPRPEPRCGSSWLTRSPPPGCPAALP